ncbi:MAG: T9SS type A sorting domain-containing protein, partial [Bacteroidales bacterium]|nr:T9SS type A sorting domain-containing protein [Bacteroidales bacterium]
GSIGTRFVATVTDQDGNTSMYSASATSVLGLENAVSEQIAIYPNPTTGLVEILNVGGNARFEVFSITGKRLISTAERVIDLSRLSNGVYFLVAYNDDQPLGATKIVKR